MSQSHLTIDFPIRRPANARALTDELPPLMPDFARTQDQLGTVHFSRFIVKGDAKLLFLSDIDGAIDTHLARLVERASPVLDAIFKHVDDAPATPIVRNPQRVITWLKAHVREPLDTYCAYEGASVQDIKACAHAAGFMGNVSQRPLLTYMAIKSRLQAFAVKLVGKVMVEGKGHNASDSIGTLHFSHWVPFDEQPHRLLHHLRRFFREVHPGLHRKDIVRIRRCLSTCHWRAAHPGSQERAGVLSVGIGKQPSADRVLQRLSRPLGSRHSSPAGRSQVTIGDHWIALASHGHAPGSTLDDGAGGDVGIAGRIKRTCAESARSLWAGDHYLDTRRRLAGG